MKGKYIYGIIKTQDKNQTLAKNGLSTVDFRDLSAVIRETEFKDYHSLAKKKVVKELTSHQQMIERIMQDWGTILPVKFGTTLKDEKEVGSVLEKGYFLFRDNLRKIEDKIEFDLVCFWDEQKAAQIAYQKDRKVQRLQKNLAKKGEITFEDKLALGKAVGEYLVSQKAEITSQILKTLENEAVESLSHVLAEVNMLLNHAFLVKNGTKKNFNYVLNLLDARFNGLVNFRLVGPLPPYSFATVALELLDQEEIEEAKKLFNLNGEVSKERIKKVYDKLAFKLHPDHGGDPLEFKLITKGYKLLRKFAEQGLIGVYLYKWEER